MEKHFIHLRVRGQAIESTAHSITTCPINLLYRLMSGRRDHLPRRTCIVLQGMVDTRYNIFYDSILQLCRSPLVDLVHTALMFLGINMQALMTPATHRICRLQLRRYHLRLPMQMFDLYIPLSRLALQLAQFRIAITISTLQPMHLFR